MVKKSKAPTAQKAAALTAMRERRAIEDLADEVAALRQAQSPRKRVVVAEEMRKQEDEIQVRVWFEELIDRHGEEYANKLFEDPRPPTPRERQHLDKYKTLRRLIEGHPDLTVAQLARDQVVERGKSEDHPGYPSKVRARENLIREWLNQYRADVARYE
jgi:hypothetical protein